MRNRIMLLLLIMDFKFKIKTQRKGMMRSDSFLLINISNCIFSHLNLGSILDDLVQILDLENCFNCRPIGFESIFLRRNAIKLNVFKI